jgi:hypothetical protein
VVEQPITLLKERPQSENGEADEAEEEFCRDLLCERLFGRDERNTGELLFGVAVGVSLRLGIPPEFLEIGVKKPDILSLITMKSRDVNGRGPDEGRSEGEVGLRTRNWGDEVGKA